MICVPLLSELVFVSILLVLLQQAQSEINTEQRSRNVISTTNDLMRCFMASFTNAIAYQVTADSQNKKNSETNLRLTKENFDKVRESLGSNSSQLANLTHIETELRPVSQSIRKFLNTELPESTMERFSYLQNQIMNLAVRSNKAQDSIDRFLAVEEAVDNAGPQLRSAARQQIQFVIVVGIALNTVVSLYLAIFFSTEITGRIKTLIENASRFSRTKPLLMPLQGSDELVDFDKTFRDSIQQIQEAENFKKQLVAIVSHELRTPLTSIDAIVNLLLAGGLGELPPATKTKLENAEMKISEVIVLINDLLDIERMEAGKFPLKITEVEINDLLLGVVRQAEEKAMQEKNVSMIVQGCSGCINVDKERVGKALLKVIFHCVQSSLFGQSIVVRAEKQENDVLISVTDMTPVSSAIELDSMFDKIQSLKPGQDGRNRDALGLALCKAIVCQHGGTVGVSQSASGDGNSYWLRFPQDMPMQS